MTEEQRKDISKISRREFLKDAGLVVGGAAVGSMALASACGGGGETTKTVTNTVTKTVTSGSGSTSTVTVTSPPITKVVETSETAKTIHLTVNGWEYDIQVESNWPLRDVLRDHCGLTSIKDMCAGYGACGSCTVIMNRRPVLSCMVLAIQCDNAIIETAEGIAEANHPLINSYIDNYCLQCGYCTPGFICTAKALLDVNKNPTEEEVREALAGNLCRCGTYQQHPKAVITAGKSL